MAGQAMSLGLDLTQAVKNAATLDKQLEKMVQHSQNIQTNMNKAFDESFASIISRIQKDMSIFGKNKIAPDFDTSKLEKGYTVLNDTVKLMETFALSMSKNKGQAFEFYDTKQLYATNRNVLEISESLNQVNEKLKVQTEAWSKAGEIAEKTLGANGQKVDKRSKAYKDLVKNIKLVSDNEIKALNEVRAMLEEELRFAKMTFDQKLEYVRKYNATRLSEEKKRAKEERALEDAHNRTLSGAKAYSDAAQSINEEKKAIQYLIAARDGLSKSTANYDKELAELNDRIQKHRISVEQLTTAEKNEKTLQPTIRNEYIRLRKELDANIEAQRKFSELKNGKPADLQALIAREQDLQNRIAAIKKNAAGLMDEVDRAYEAEKARRSIELTEQTEAKKAEIARRRLKEQLAENSKYGSISTNSAERLINATDNAKNIQQEERAITKLVEARKHLDKNATNYRETLDKLNRKIAEHTHNVKMATDAQYAKNEAEKQERTKNTTFQGALDYSKQAKSINEQVQAINYLKEARDKLDRSTMSKDEYGAKVRALNDEIKIQQTEVDKLRGKQDALKKSQEGLAHVADKLGRRLATLFSISAIASYAKKVIDVTGEFEIQHRAMQTLIGDVDKANKIWDKTVKLAVNSPFRVKELVTYTKQLSAYRIETEKLYDKTKMLADISAGLGVDMNRIILAYGQVKAANYLRGTELRQFSEAGINILKELSDYYSEIEKKHISVGEVFERVSKRMVSFADVDKVLQRVTSEGREFYKMQEKQAETIQGLKMNLQDSIDLMMNDIGQQNRGVIAESIKLMKTLVENWRTVSSFATAGLIAFALAKIYKALQQVSIAMISASKGIKAFTLSSNALVLTFKQLGRAIKTLTATMYSNPLFWPAVAVAAIASVTTAIIAHRREVNRLNKQYDEAAESEIRKRLRLEKITDEIERNNDAIREFSKIETKSEDDIANNTAAIEANELALEKLKTQYPDIFSAIKKEEDGTINLTTALEEYNRQLRINIALQQQANGTFWRDDLYTNYDDVIERQGITQSQINKIKQQTASMMSKVEVGFYEGKITKDEYNAMKQFAKEIDNASSSADILNVNLEALTSKGIRKLKIGVGNFADLRKRLVQVAANEETAYKRLGRNIEEQSSSIQAALWGLNDAESRGEWVEGYLDDMKIVDENVRAWAKEEIKKYVTLEIIYPNPNDDDITELEPWAKRVSAAITEINNKILDDNPEISVNDLFPLPTAGQTREQFLEVMSPALDVAKATYDEMQKIEDQATIDRTEALAPYAEAIERILNIFKEDKNKGGSDDKFNRTLSLIKELREEYLRLIKTFEKDVSVDKVTRSYANAMKELGLNIQDVDFTTETGLISYLKSLEPLAEKYGQKAKYALQKTIGEVQVEIELRDKQEDQEKAIKEIEDMFGNYEVTLEMEKLNIPPDLAKRLFGVDAISLDDIRQEIETELATAKATEGQQDLVEKLEAQLEKVEDLENKSLKERMNEYMKYLQKEQNERIRFKMEEIQKLADIEKMHKDGILTSVEADTMISNIQKETTQNIEKSRWEEFSKSAAYLNTLEDASKATTASIKGMLSQLEEMRSSMIAAGIPASDLKEILNQIDKAEEELEARAPFKSTWNDLKTVMGGYSEYIQAKKEEKALLEEQIQLNKDLKIAELLVAEETANKRDSEEFKRLLEEEKRLASLEKGSHEYNEQLALVTQLTKSILPQKAAYNEIVDRVEVVNTTLDSTQAKIRKWRDSANDIAESFTNVGNAILDISSELSETLSKTGMLSDENKKIVDSILNVGGDLLGIGSNAMQLIANPMSLQSWVGLITSSISLVGNLAQTGDALRQKELDAEIKRMKTLEKRYEALEEAIDSAYSTNEIRQAYAEAQKNIDAQLKSLEEQKRLQESMKKTDEDAIEELNEQYEELVKKQEELTRERVEKAGGTYDFGSIAEQFVDAWVSAFEETGDGLKGLEDEWDEYYKNLVKKQAVQQYITEIMKPLLKSINADLEDNGILDEAEKLKLDSQKILESVDLYMKQIQSVFGGFGTGESELSGLSGGISGITEDQADILAAYWNAVRFSTASIDLKMDSILSKLDLGEGDTSLLDNIYAIKVNSDNIHELLQRVSKSGGVDAINVRLI